LHLVSLAAGQQQLVYLRKRATEKWSSRHQVLINQQWHPTYTNYYHKLNVDRHGRLFLSFVWFMDDLFANEVAAYEAKYGTVLEPDVPTCVPTPFPGTPAVPAEFCSFSLPGSGNRPHDPALLMSDDGGDTWHLATTPDFLVGMGLCTLPVVPVPAEGPHFVPPWEPVESVVEAVAPVLWGCGGGGE
jgi:hypothetical protein